MPIIDPTVLLASLILIRDDVDDTMNDLESALEFNRNTVDPLVVADVGAKLDEIRVIVADINARVNGYIDFYNHVEAYVANRKP